MFTYQEKQNLLNIYDRLNPEAKRAYSFEYFVEKAQKENDAYIIASSQFDVTYIIIEMIDSLMIDAFGIFRNKPYFKNIYKKQAKTAQDRIKKHIRDFVTQSNQFQRIREYSDYILDDIEPDIKKLLNSLEMEIFVAGAKTSAKDIAYMCLITTMIDVGIADFEHVINALERFYKGPNYRDRFSNARIDDVLYYWKPFSDHFYKVIENVDFDPNKSMNITNGLNIIFKKITDKNLKIEASNNVSIPEDEEQVALVDGAFKTFGSNIKQGIDLK